MATSITATRGAVVTPHHLATQSAMNVLRAGGTAIEAAVAAAATIAVVSPHQNSIGGDSFWTIIPPNGDPIVIEACGAAGLKVNPEFYEGYSKIPIRGPKAATTVAGTVGGWQEALNYVTECGYNRMSISTLLADAIYYAEHGFPVSTSLEAALVEVDEEGWVPKSSDFAKTFFPNGVMLKKGDLFCQKQLAETLKHLVDYGLGSFYKGKLATLISNDMAKVGLPITDEDLHRYTPVRKTPLKLNNSYGELLNVPPPSQGLASLAMLGILEKLNINGENEGEFIHATVEATKEAFALRDAFVADPISMSVNPKDLISNDSIKSMAQKISFKKASKIKTEEYPADTIWLGVMDAKGFSVSFIQSTFHLFGSGVLLPETGIIWHNRGTAFSLDKTNVRYVKPGKKPFHTLNPPAAFLSDGRVMVYGTKGGNGQPQTQAAIFHRYVVQQLPLQKSILEPRWVYGGTLKDEENKTLKLEDRFPQETLNYLKERGHKIVMLPSYSEIVGTAGMLVRHPSGVIEGAYDFRGNGSVAGF